jgi:hypothetical protein
MAQKPCSRVNMKLKFRDFGYFAILLVLMIGSFLLLPFLAIACFVTAEYQRMSRPHGRPMEELDEEPGLQFTGGRLI